MKDKALVVVIAVVISALLSYLIVPLGPQVVPGLQGPQGIQGLQGKEGSIGPPGTTGSIGSQGFQGHKGDKGDTGPQGIGGIQGPVGPRGPEGLQGVIGPQGIQGNEGDIGLQGPQGAQGKIGPQGEIGPKGAQGPVGPRGPQGPRGPVGPGNQLVIAMGLVFDGNSPPLPQDPFLLKNYNVESVTWDPVSSSYYIVLAAEVYGGETNYIVLVTPQGGEGLLFPTAGAGGCRGQSISRVVLYDKFGDRVRGSFQFLVFDNPEE